MYRLKRERVFAHAYKCALSFCTIADFTRLKQREKKRKFNNFCTS